MAKVEEMGGAVAAIEKGFQKSEIERSAYDVALGIDSASGSVVGLNRYRSETEEKYDPLRVDPSIEQDQRERLRLLREKRDNAAVEKALAELKEAGGRRRQRALPDAHRAEGARHGRRGLQRAARGVGRLHPAGVLLGLAADPARTDRRARWEPPSAPSRA
jgi:methylmalonyl-CoA mutase N-terminal domain/subunit